MRTNFRMPDTLSIGLGGGSLVRPDPNKAGAVLVGPQSVGYELTTKAKVFGGDTLTTTDICVAAGHEQIGDPSKVAGIDPTLVTTVEETIAAMINVAVDRMKTSATAVPVIIVGGGSILIQRPVVGASEIVKPSHFAVANAIGAAIAQIGGETDRIFSLASMSRDEALAQAKQEAIDKAVAAGANRATVEIVDVEEVPLAYLPGNATRIAVKAVGDLA